VLPMRAAVNLHDQRVLPCLVEAGRLEHPALDLQPIGGHEDVALGSCHEPIAQPRVGVGQPTLTPTIGQDDIARAGGVGDAGSDPPMAYVEVVYAAALTGELAGHPALQVDRVQLRYARPTGLKVEAVALVRPLEARARGAPHVGHDAAAGRSIQAFCETARFSTRRRDHPDALVRAGPLPYRSQEGD